MKSIKILAAALLAMTFVRTASAQTTTIHICGSTAFRAAAVGSIETILKPGYTCAYDSSSATSSTAIYGAGQSIFSGTLSSNNAVVIIKTEWTGSMAGVIDLVTQNPLIAKFIPSTVTMSAGPGGTNVHGAYTAENGVADASFTDAYASSVAKAVSGATVNPPIVVGSSTYNSGASITSAINNASLHAAGSLGETIVGVVPFVWETGYLGTGNTPPFTNMTQQTAVTLIKAGSAPVSMLSGNPNDGFNYLFFFGRNEDSGTRIAYDAEPETGFGNSTNQYQFTFTNNQTTGSGLNTGGFGSSVSSIALWPANYPVFTEPNISWSSAGHSGYQSGGDVSNVISSTNVLPSGTSGPSQFTITSGVPTSWTQGSSTGYFVSALGVADAVGGGTIAAPANHGFCLSYNGIPYSVSNVQNGAYSFWTFEHLYYLSLTGNALQTVNDLADKIFNTTATYNSSGQLNQPNAVGILYDTNSFFFVRSLEGGEITPNY